MSQTEAQHWAMANQGELYSDSLVKTILMMYISDQCMYQFHPGLMRNPYRS